VYRGTILIYLYYFSASSSYRRSRLSSIAYYNYLSGMRLILRAKYLRSTFYSSYYEGSTGT
ncbi:hypothetical protein MPH_11561, partial [Macrophomina phaseolina MS6]